MPKAKPAKKPEPPTQAVIQRRHYARLWVASNQALLLLDKMEEAGAIRLPFFGFKETVDNLRNAVTVEK